MKKVLNKLPEILLLITVLYYWNETSVFLNPIAIILLLFISFSIFTRSKLVKILTSVIFALLSLYMMLAVISEFREFDIGSSEGTKLLVIGSFIFITTFVSSVIMGVRSIISK